jgi:hypothetical protein
VCAASLGSAYMHCMVGSGQIKAVKYWPACFIWFYALFNIIKFIWYIIVVAACMHVSTY